MTGKVGQVIVFVGPSLPLAEARKLLDADYRPPAQAGDLYLATLERPAAICLIDGVFEAVPAVWRKEILYALTEGIPVFGASSMGALRAVELQPFGMRGVGRVFEAFASGEIEDDDEVALIHAPRQAGYRPLSEPLVNIREVLQRAVSASVVSPAAKVQLVAIAKQQFYPERNWNRITALGAQEGVSTAEIERLLAFIAAEEIDVKREDALSLLRYMAEISKRGFEPFKPAFQLQHSVFFTRFTEALCEGRGNRSAEEYKGSNGED